jgi:hypothetical protein
MKHRASQILYAYWNEVRGHRMAPQRFDIEPSRISQILSQTLILECESSECFPHRLAGTRLCEQFGNELRGADFLDGWSDDDTSTLERALLALTRQGAALVLEIETAAEEAPEPALFEALLLPLLHPHSSVTRVLGVMSAREPQPEWLGRDRPVRRLLRDLAIIWPDGKPHSVTSMLARQSPLVASLASARRVVSNRRRFRVLDGGLAKSSNDAAE